MQTNTEIYNIYFDEEINTVVMEWDGYATSSQFKEGTELMLNTLIKNNFLSHSIDTITQKDGFLLWRKY